MNMTLAGQKNISIV